MKTHDLKIWPEPFRAVKERIKKFEIRKDDRGFEEGDFLRLNEFNPETEEYTGDWEIFEASYILRDPEFGIKKGYCVISLGSVF